MPLTTDEQIGDRPMTARDLTNMWGRMAMTFAIIAVIESLVMLAFAMRAMP
jgi:hypothetical protein